MLTLPSDPTWQRTNHAVRDINPVSLCIIGAGPRGLAVAERVCANAARTGQPVTLYVVDPYLRSGSRVWQIGQPHVLVMNTVASQVTMFTDDSVDCEARSARGRASMSGRSRWLQGTRLSRTRRTYTRRHVPSAPIPTLPGPSTGGT
ncbi:FAD/NAD(P)-binding protein [Streptomyces sp. NPDC058612]|uniref:FAD/NAD(P)-binding protein n=1 Tax=Streptomyces sp. NPDC058612 TaxID=3346555 RepID=UPI00365B0A8B